MDRNGIVKDVFRRNTFCILIAEKIRGVDEISNIKNFPGVNDFNKWY